MAQNAPHAAPKPQTLIHTLVSPGRKWHAGMATPDHTPAGRGYDTSLLYFAPANGQLLAVCRLATSLARSHGSLTCAHFSRQIIG